MDKKYRWLTRREADTLVEAGAPVEWRYNIDRFATRPAEDRMTDWMVLKPSTFGRSQSVDGYDDQFRAEVE